MEHLNGSRGRGVPAPARDGLDLKALRLAVHGWRLGNPLVYKPHATDLVAVARELASAGVASGALVLDDARQPDVSDPALASQAAQDRAHGILILRAALTPEWLGAAAARVVAEVARAALGRPCAVRRRWEVFLQDSEDDQRHDQRLCRVDVEQADGDAVLLGLRFDLGVIWTASQHAALPARTLFTRPDWREVFLARALHALDDQLDGSQ